MWTRDAIEMVGLAAGFLTTAAALPQIVHAIRRRSMRDVSLGMLGSMFAGLALWLGYGVLLHSLSLIVWNAVTLGFYAVLLTLKLRFDGAVQAGGLRSGANLVEDVER
jgi:MtN3 and saliva related transmembrane protein